MAPDFSTAKDIAVMAAPLTAAIIELWVKPKLTALHKYITTDKALFEHSLSGKFSEYLLRTYEKHSFTHLLVFPNQQKRLVEIYVPLTLRRVGSEYRYTIDGFKEDFLPAYKKALVRDTAGMGKSTLLKYMFLGCVNKNAGVPVFIELRKLRGDVGIPEYIINELNPIDDEIDKNFILKLIKEGGFIFFLDGYDEIPFKERDKVTSNLQDFISKAGDNLFILTSRPDSSLPSFADFQEFAIDPLDTEEAFELLRKYDNKGRLSGEIISKLRGDTINKVQDFLTNPLLVSLLYKSYEHKPIIPFKKHTFYRQVFDALFESHDLTKGGAFTREKHSQLHSEDFHRVLRALGFITVRIGQIEYDKDSLLAHIRDARQRCPDLNFKEGDFLKDLLTTVPLFNSEGDYYKWSHKSIQEYFAAQYIWLDAKHNQENILRRMAQNKENQKYINVLDLYYDMDNKTFRRTILYDLICKFLTHMDSAYSQIDRGKVKEEFITARKILTFPYLWILYSFGGLQKEHRQYDDNIFTAKEYLSSKGLDPELLRVRSHSSNGMVSCVDYTYDILSLLHEKHEDIFLGAERKDFHIHHHGASLEWVGDRAIIVTDDPDSEVNSPKRFESVNYAIHEPTSHQYLNPDKCTSLKSKIEEEIEREKAEEF